MCTKYLTPDDAAIERYWSVRPDQAWASKSMFPRAAGPFIRKVAARVGAIECIVGQWGLIPPFAKEPRVPYSTFNARFEEITDKPSYRNAWLRDQRCIIPAASFEEPNWETGRNVWWRFTRQDGAPWGLAGLWNAWVDRSTGEVHQSYTMLTVNADGHPLMGRMHKPDPTLGPDEQDKRSVIAIEVRDVERWLLGTKAEVATLVAPPSMDILYGAPADDGPRGPARRRA